MFISDHRQIDRTPLSEMTLQELEHELRLLRNMEVDPSKVQVEPYHDLIMRIILDREAQVKNAIELKRSTKIDNCPQCDAECVGKTTGKGFQFICSKCAHVWVEQ